MDFQRANGEVSTMEHLVESSITVNARHQPWPCTAEQTGILLIALSFSTIRLFAFEEDGIKYYRHNWQLFSHYLWKGSFGWKWIEKISVDETKALPMPMLSRHRGVRIYKWRVAERYDSKMNDESDQCFKWETRYLSKIWRDSCSYWITFHCCAIRQPVVVVFLIHFYFFFFWAFIFAVW